MERLPNLVTFSPEAFGWEQAPCVDAMCSYIRALGGDPEHFTPFFMAACDECAWEAKMPREEVQV
jgi:hypothetical protein